MCSPAGSRPSTSSSTGAPATISYSIVNNGPHSVEINDTEGTNSIAGHRNDAAGTFVIRTNQASTVLVASSPNPIDVIRV